jgi:hypothetical protein
VSVRISFFSSFFCFAPFGCLESLGLEKSKTVTQVWKRGLRLKYWFRLLRCVGCMRNLVDSPFPLPKVSNFIYFFVVLLLVRGCPKAYHPSCIKRDESFFKSRAKWNCGMS